MVCTGGADIFRNVDDDWPGPARACQMKCLTNNCRKIAWFTNEVVMLHARTSDADRVYLLECVSSDQVFRHLARYDDYGCGIQVGVGDAGDCVGRARAGGYQHNANASGCARITFRHVNCTLLVPDEVMRNSIAGAPEFVVDVKYGAARVTKDRVDTFKAQRFHEHFGARGLRCGYRVGYFTFSNHFAPLLSAPTCRRFRHKAVTVAFRCALCKIYSFKIKINFIHRRRTCRCGKTLNVWKWPSWNTSRASCRKRAFPRLPTRFFGRSRR